MSQEGAQSELDKYQQAKTTLDWARKRQAQHEKCRDIAYKVLETKLEAKYLDKDQQDCEEIEAGGTE